MVHQLQRVDAGRGSKGCEWARLYPGIAHSGLWVTDIAPELSLFGGAEDPGLSPVSAPYGVHCPARMAHNVRAPQSLPTCKAGDL